MTEPTNRMLAISMTIDARLHTHIPMDAPYEIPTEYDPNLALAIIWGKDLAEAKKRGTDYLDELTLSGADGTGAEMKTNIRYLREKTATILQF